MKVRSALAVSSVLSLIWAMAFADANTIRKELQSEYAAYDTATLKGMASLKAWCEAKMTRDFVVKPADGKAMSGKEFLKVLNQMITSPDPNWGGVKDQRTTITKLEMRGADAVATITSKANMSTTDSKGEYGPKNGKHTITIIKDFREIWIKKDGRWKIKRSDELSGSMQVDGKPMRDRTR
jgi:hypothetical protein